MNSRHWFLCVLLGGVLAFGVDPNQEASAAEPKKKPSQAAPKPAKGKKKPAGRVQGKTQKAKPKAKRAAGKRGKRASKQEASSKANAAVQKIAVAPFDGPNQQKLHESVVSALAATPGISEVVEPPEQVEDSPEAAVATARESAAAAVLYGSVSKARGQFVLKVTLRNGADGEIASEKTYKARSLARLRKNVQKRLPVELADAIAQSKPPEPEPRVSEPEPAPPEATKQEPGTAERGAAEAPEQARAEASAQTGGRPSPLELGAGVRYLSRDLSYSGEPDAFSASTEPLSTYNGPGVAGFLNLRWYPIAHVQGGALAHVGLIAGYERGFGIKAKAPNGNTLGVTYATYYAGLRGRIPILSHELGVSGSYGQQRFGIDDDATLIPDVKYSFLRAGLDGRFRFDWLVVGFSAGYRQVLSAGEIQEDIWFPNSDVSGFDLGVFAGYGLSRQFDVLAGVDLQRYSHTLNAEAGAMRVADRAADRYLSGWLGVVWHLPGAE